MDRYETGRSTDADPTSVRTREDLATFVAAMSAELASAPDAWENSTLPNYLEALGTYVTDVEAYYTNVLGRQVPDQPTWELVALLLAAASGYE